MKIIHLCGDFDKFHVGLSDALMERGLDSTILAYKLRHGDFKVIASNSTTIKVNSDVKFRRTPFFHASRVNSAYKKIKEHLNFDCDIVHAHMLFTDGFLAYKIKKEFNKKYIVAIRSSDVNYNFVWSLPWLRKQAIRVLCEAERVVFISPEFKKYLMLRIGVEYEEIIEKKSIILPNGIDSFWFKNKLQKKRSPPNLNNEISILCVGDICSNKNQLSLATYIERMNAVLDKRFSLAIAGRIIDQNIFSKLKRYDFVRYLGILNKEQLVSLYSRSDIFALASIRETFGLVYPEAMTQGLPIVYTRGQGIDGYFPVGDVGYPISPFSYSEFMDSILKILGNYENISENCLRRSDIFTWENIARAYENIYCAIENE